MSLRLCPTHASRVGIVLNSRGHNAADEEPAILPTTDSPLISNGRIKEGSTTRQNGACGQEALIGNRANSAAFAILPR